MSAQLDLNLARRRRDAGKKTVSKHNRQFLEEIRDYAQRFAELNGEINIDDLRTYADLIWLKPDHKNVWGCVFHGKHWHCIGFQPSKLVSNHGRVIRRWVWKP